jgi:hypothetical protein
VERDITLTGNSKQVLIIPSSPTKDGLKYELFIDVPNKRTYTLRQFLNRYLNELFNEWVISHIIIVCYEPNQATIVFDDTEKGRELATMFKLMHVEYDQQPQLIGASRWP